VVDGLENFGEDSLDAWGLPLERLVGCGGSSFVLFGVKGEGGWCGFVSFSSPCCDGLGRGLGVALVGMPELSVVIWASLPSTEPLLCLASWRVPVSLCCVEPGVQPVQERPSSKDCCCGCGCGCGCGC